MTESQMWREVDRILNRSRNLRFTLERCRSASGMVWQAVFFTEKGRVVARSRAGERIAALDEILREYGEKGK